MSQFSWEVSNAARFPGNFARGDVETFGLPGFEKRVNESETVFPKTATVARVRDFLEVATVARHAHRQTKKNQLPCAVSDLLRP